MHSLPPLVFLVFFVINSFSKICNKLLWWRSATLNIFLSLPVPVLVWIKPDSGSRAWSSAQLITKMQLISSSFMEFSKNLQYHIWCVQISNFGISMGILTIAPSSFVFCRHLENGSLYMARSPLLKCVLSWAIQLLSSQQCNKNPTLHSKPVSCFGSKHWIS